ncbi:MAG: aKG-HExxH-type peptide beta-hydroxylase [Alphaproteobacteria bacterium]
MRFGPDPEEARALDARMHRGLKESLDHIAEAAEEGAREAVNEADRTVLTRISETAAAIPAGRVYSPATFGYYYELAIALTDDDLDAALAAAEKLTRSVAKTNGENGRRILALGQDADRDAIYLRRLDQLPDATFNPPPAPLADGFSSRLEEARALLARSTPELLEEIDAIVREIMLAVGKPEDKGQFDGASHYQLWGLLFLNPTFHSTPVALAEVLAHESGHSVLFGHTYDEPLVFNPDTDLYPSPLRLDRRPMDGIYHATWVSARMHWAMSRIAEDASVSAAERAAARKAADEDAANFAAGISVVDEHGRLSGTGRRLMEAARDYMNGAA